MHDQQTILLRRLSRGARISLLLLVLILATAASVQAHRVIIFAWVEDGTVYTESQFPGGAPVQGGEIEVRESSGETVLTGITDEEGIFSFDLDTLEEPTALKMVLKAGMGHQAQWELPLAEVAAAMGRMSSSSGGAGAEKVDAAADRQQDFETSFAGRDVARTAGQQAGCLDAAAVQALVEASLDKKISPVMKRLLAMEEAMAIGLDDVMAGIGYIFGLAGVAAMVYSRKRTNGS